jgi:hypothetical protein
VRFIQTETFGSIHLEQVTATAEVTPAL